MKRWLYIFPAVILALLAACGEGSSSASMPAVPTAHGVTISWLASHETAVNTLGGGYLVNISGQAPIRCPFTGFAPPCTSPTSVQLTLMTGSYTVTVVAYSALNGPGSSSGSTSAPSAPLVVHVP